MNEDRRTINTVKQLLDESAQHLPPHIQARLDASIAQTLTAHAKRVVAESQTNRQPTLKPHDSYAEGLLNTVIGWFNRPALSLALSAAFVLTAVSGVIKFGLDYQQASDTETADLDAAILSDDLPTDAYLDSGFIDFTKRKPKEAEVPSDDSIDQWMQNAPEARSTSI